MPCASPADHCRLPRPRPGGLRPPGRGRRRARRVPGRRPRAGSPTARWPPGPGRWPPVSTRWGCRGARGSRSSRTTPRGCSRRSSGSPAGAGCWCRSTSGCARTRSATSSSTPAREILLVDPEVDEELAGRHRQDPAAPGHREPTRRCCASTSSHEPWAEADEDATATINYTSGTTARPKGVQITHRNIWVNAVTFALHTAVTDRDVYLHTLPMFHANGWGMPFAMTGLGVPAGRHPQDRRRRHPAPGPRPTASRSCAPPPPWWRACSTAAATWEGEVPGPRHRVRVICAGAPPPSRTIARIEHELGWEFIQIYGLTETSPLLTINRGSARRTTTSRSRSAPRGWPAPARPRSGCGSSDQRVRRGAGPQQRGARGLLGAARGDRRGAGGRLVPHRRRRPRRRARATSPSATGRRT